jgi:hypothetical protein
MSTRSSIWLGENKARAGGENGRGCGGTQENSSLGTALAPKLKASRPEGSSQPSIPRGFCARTGDG